MVAAAGAWAVAAVGQESMPTTAEARAWELPPNVRAALDQTQDFTFNFDQPGFHAVAETVKRNSRSPGFLQTPIEVTDWRDLLERPGDFRGLVVTVEGVVGRNKTGYTLPSHSELGVLWQLELRRDDQPITCTVIFTENAADVPLNSSIRVTGYFVMIRQYYGPSNRVQQAALVVAPGPTTISHRAGWSAGDDGLDWRWMMAAVVLGLLITVILLRWAGSVRRHSLYTLRSSSSAPVSLADDLAAWSGQEHPRDAEADELSDAADKER